MLRVIGVLVFLIAMTIAIFYLRRRMSNRRFHLFICFVFFSYLCGNLYITLASRQAGIVSQFDLVPFNSYHSLFHMPDAQSTSLSGLAKIMLYGLTPFEGISLNILLYYPFGYLLPLIFPSLRMWLVIIAGCLCSIATETAQYILEMGWCETDDVIHNTLGTAIGVWVWHLQSKRLNKSTQ